MSQPLYFVPKSLIGYHGNVGVALVASALLLAVAKVIYNVFLHPLRDYPGPLHARGTILWKMGKMATGQLPHGIRELHESYGPVVRIAPNELSFIEAQAWKDIYAHHGANEMAKDPGFYKFMGTGSHEPAEIVTADRDIHNMLRRQMSHGFSDRALREQAPIIGQYTDLLIKRLDENCENGTKALDMVSWLNFTTFDIIGNLAFGSDFGGLENTYNHPWVDAIAKNQKEVEYIRILIQYIPMALVRFMSESGVFSGRSTHYSYATDKIKSRINAKTERPDFIEGLLKKEGLTETDLVANASSLVIGGSETTATLLSGAFFLLGMHPEALAKLVEEVRSSFKSEEEITLSSVNGLEYMLACLNESLRQYPPVSIGMPRVVPKGGRVIAGKWIPGGTTVAISQLAANYSEANFTQPRQFIPERFLGDERFSKDHLSAMQPFIIGPRNCIGRNLAYAEMRLILARVLYKFDLELAPKAREWLKDQRVYTLWDKPELPVYLTPAVRKQE